MRARSGVFCAVALGASLLLLNAAACGSGRSGGGGPSRAATQVPTQPAVSARPAAGGAAGAAAAATVAARPAAAPATAGSSSSASSSSDIPDATAGGAVSLDRKILRNAELGLVVKDTAAASDAITGIANGFGGYVAASDLSRESGNLRGTLTVRVPAERFDDAMTQFRALGVKVQRENVSSQDVTQEYADLTARVTNLQDTQDQLRLLLDTVRQKSTNAQDILTVYRELTTINGQIEQAKGRQQYLDKLSTLATIVVSLAPEEAAAPPPVASPPWSPRRTLADAAGALAGAGELALQALIWALVLVVPLAAIFALAGAAAIGLRRLLRRRQAAAAP